MKSLPYKIFLVYVIFTLGLSFWGPIEYYGYNKISVALYMLAFLIMFSTGYFFANRYKVVVSKSIVIDENSKKMLVEKNKNKIIRIITFSIFIAFLSIFFEFISILVTNPSAFNISNMAQNYLNANVANVDQSYSLTLLFRFFSGFFRNVSIILGLYYWRILKRKSKLQLIGYLVLLIAVNMIAYGTQKFLGDLVIYIIVILAIKMLDKNKVNSRKIILLAGIVIILMVIIFSAVQADRYNSIGITLQNYASRSDGLQNFKPNHLIFKLFGTGFGFGIATLTGYLSQGYFGLSLCLKLPFEWTYGIGNSYFMSRLFSVMFNVGNIYEETYLNRMFMQFGRDGLRSWNTIFPWLASDFTFFGTLIIFVFVAYIWQTSWLEVVNYRNPISIVLFTTLSLGLVFLPANNQLFNSIDTFIATIITLIFWLKYHKKFNYLMKFDR